MIPLTVLMGRTINVFPTVLHISAIVRVAGPIPAWKIVCASSSSVVPILISGVNPTSKLDPTLGPDDLMLRVPELSLFQHEIDKLAIALSRTALDMGSTSSVLYKSRDPNGQQYISVLDMKGWVIFNPFSFRNHERDS